ncbi:hypothetical protein PJ15_0522 [Acinetobacter sp. neg1]|nr:hypothetical protein PJ15_0522 [Acinetobacter sp. neg1]
MVIWLPKSFFASSNLLLVSVILPSKPSLTFVNWSTLTASLPFTPSATLVIVLLPALMPSLVMLGPSLMVKPLLFNTLSPVVMLSNFASFNNSILIPSSVVRVITFSPLVLSSAVAASAPPTMFNLSPNLRCTSLPALPAKLRPLLVRSFTPLVTLSSTDLIASLMLFLPVPPMLLVVMLPSGLTVVLPPMLFLMLSEIFFT